MQALHIRRMFGEDVAISRLTSVMNDNAISSAVAVNNTVLKTTFLELNMALPASAAFELLFSTRLTVEY